MLTAPARRNGPVSEATTSGLGVRVWIDRGIEAAWLVAAIVTPMIVLSETSFLSKTELPKVATIRLSAGLVLLLMLMEAGLWHGDADLRSRTARTTGSRQRFVGIAAPPVRG